MMITLAYVSPQLTIPLRTKLAVARLYIEWSAQATNAAELAERSGNYPVASEYLSRAVEYTKRAAVLTENRQFNEFAEIYQGADI